MPKTVILGGGIHGSSIAYYLAKRGIQTLIVESSGIASAASGKAGGFLARNWGSGSTVQLHQVSYDLYSNLAEELSLQTYRKIPTLSVDGNRKGSSVCPWLDRRAVSSFMDTDTAQVTPHEITVKFIDAAKGLGSEVIIGRANKVRVIEGVVKGVEIENVGFIEAETVIVCLGPWSGVFCEDNFDISMPMEGVKSTSLIYSDLAAIRSNPYALFCAEDANGCHLEFYPRPNGDLYICGCGGSDYVSGDRLRPGGDCSSSDAILADPARVAAASRSFQSMSSVGDAQPSMVQACMRPCPPDGLPIMGAIPGVQGAYASCGHNCWGILWAPASGLAMSELIADGASKTIDLRAFSPARFGSRKETRRGRKMVDKEVGEQW